MNNPDEGHIMKHTKELEALKLSKAQIIGVQAIISSYQGSRANPAILDAEGNIVAKWCTKHAQYELADTFPKNSRSSDGLYSHCRFAEKRAKSYAAKVSKLKDKFFNTEDSKEQAKIKKEIDKLNTIKNNYDFQEDAPKSIIEALTKAKLEA